MQLYSLSTKFSSSVAILLAASVMKSGLAHLETMSETLLDVEYNQIKGSLDLNKHLKTKTRSKPTVTFKKEALKSALSASISDESYTLATLEERILDTLKSITVNKPITVKDVATVTDDHLSPGTLEATVTTSMVPSVDLTPPMELCENINVATSVEDVVEHINFAKIGNREIYYFGNQRYSYGKTVHPPNPYPDVLRMLKGSMSKPYCYYYSYCIL